MRQVVFNALQTSLSGGIGRYCHELSKAIYDQHKVDFKIVIREEDKNSFSFADIKDLIIVKNIKNAKQRNFYEQFKLPKLILKKYPNAVIHYPDTMAPIFAKNKVIITVHDLAFKSVKDAFTWKTTLWKNFITNLSIKKADKIVAITEFTKSEMLKYYPKINDKISVIYNGFNDFSKEHINCNNINKNILDLKDSKYILTVSTISPRKNIDGIIKAFDLIKNKISDYKLVVAGKNGWLYEEVYKIVDNLNLSDRVVFTGGINDDELKFLYKNANLFVYPSFYEGFGLPPLEAMSFKIPTIASNVSSLPEVIQMKECLFDPFDYKEISKLILKIENNQYFKDNIIKNQSQILKSYSWNKCGNNMVKFYLEG
ncbi:glycosyltransferase family 4 protein [Clostridium neuense]|uniref:Glycosyltransferase family 4 protein n=1 Tax=Clostridium neuense TaxID=1728934 RepID=A0ABW8TAF0_9CLOT